MSIKHISNSLAPELAYNEVGIVLHTLKYSENKMIVHMLTKGRGRCNFITTMSLKVRKNIFQPMTILEFQAIKSKTELGVISQAELGIPLHNLSMDLSKCTISIFLAELLYRIVKEPLDDVNMYNFVEDSIVQLNDMEVGIGNFHLWFLVHFAYYMGYHFPHEYHSGMWLDIKSGAYTDYAPIHNLRIAPQYAEVISKLQMMPLDQVCSVELNRQSRTDILNGVVDYFSYHCDNFSSVKSIEILAQVF